MIFQRVFSGLYQLWYKDTGAAVSIGPGVYAGFAARHGYIVVSPNPKGTFSFSVPLKHIFGFVGDYEKIVCGFKHEITLNRKDNNDAIFRLASSRCRKGTFNKMFIIYADRYA